MTQPDPESHKEGPPLLEAHGVRFFSHPEAAPIHFRIPEGNVYLQGTGRFIDALVQPGQHLSGGEFMLGGAPAQAQLKSGWAAICPSELPVPRSMRLHDALKTSAYLAGCTEREVSRALEQVGLDLQRKLKVGELSPEEHRRAGIAHGLITQPRLILFARPFRDLTDRSRRDVARLIERITQERSWILAGEPSCGVSSDMRAHAAWVISADAGALSVSQGSPPAPTCYFLRLTKTPAGLASEFKNRGATVTQSENPRVMLVFDMEPHEIAAVCEQFSDCTVVSLQPAEERGFRSSHARSAL